VLTRLDQGIQEEDLFAAALALPASERGAYLKRACVTEPDLLARLTALIDDFGRAAAFVAETSIRAWDSVDQIGPYRLLNELGEGGCGIAYLAEQTTPLKREVAVKVIKPGMDTKAVIARFEAERQALALMDHPNVARVFDAGATGEGRPYFVMELVRGIRITQYCDQSRLTIPERLSLFIQVCQAIQHAHQKGIIHRDIKPSNVLVTIHDGLPVAKVIDFGIAKATQGRLIDRTLHTEVDQIMGTPAYISPEQTEPAQRAVDTRSDLYSLGVLLYELITGETPFDAHELAQASVEQLRERLRAEEPPRPSSRLNSLADEPLARIANSSDTPAATLVKEVREDLDWIVMQCLEKEPARRYQAVNELMADIERYLRHEPVLARPPSLAYTFRKLARRNRSALVASLAALAFVVFITAFAVTMAVQAQRIAAERDQAEHERQRAQKVSNVAMAVFAMADPFQTLANEVSGPALLDEAGKSIERELRDQPTARARLLQALGNAYAGRGDYRAAVHYLKEATRTASLLNGAEQDALKTPLDLAMALLMTGDLRLARETLDSAELLAKQSKLERSLMYARLRHIRARIDVSEGRIADARAEFDASLRLFRELDGPRSVKVAEILSELSVTFAWTDDLPRAERLAREAVAIFEVSSSPMHPDRIRAEVILAATLNLRNHADAAAEILDNALPRQIQLFGPNSLPVTDTLDALAMIRYSQGRLVEAEKLSRDAIAAARISYGERHAGTANTSITLARTLFDLKRYSEAEMTLQEVLDIYAETLPPDHQYIASAEYFLGEVLLATNRPAEAESVLTASMNRWKRGDAPPWRAMRSANALGEALYRQGRTAEGGKYLSESLRELSSDPKADREAKDKARARAKRYLRTTLASR
jgi:eukaryotic-like serine/threonine-protein kinase